MHRQMRDMDRMMDAMMGDPFGGMMGRSPFGMLEVLFIYWNLLEAINEFFHCEIKRFRNRLLYITDYVGDEMVS